MIVYLKDYINEIRFIIPTMIDYVSIVRYNYILNIGFGNNIIYQDLKKIDSI